MSPTAAPPTVPRPVIDGERGPVDAQQVRAMFDQIPCHYDLLNTVLTGGLDERWRRRTVAETGLQLGGSALDVCCGTGVLTRLLVQRVGVAGRVTGVDFSVPMLEVARRRVPAARFVEGDATTLEGIPDSSVDAVTVGFGLRNIPDRMAALSAAHRVLRPGGRLVALECARARLPVAGALSEWYMAHIPPLLGRLLNPRSEAYTYLAESVAAYPDPETVRRWMLDAGFHPVRVIALALGTVSLHVAVRRSEGR